MRNEEMESCPDLASLVDAGYKNVLQMILELINELKETADDSDQALKHAIAELNRVLNRDHNQEVLLALLGEMSSGKTSLVNAALGYPLLPVAKVTTSACPLEIRYGKEFKLQVYTLADGQENVIFTFDNPEMLPLEIREKMLAYAKKCITSRILVCENFDYYYDIRKEDADLHNVLHCAQLLIALLNGYLGEDYVNISKRREELINDREQLFQAVFGIPANTGIGVRIWIDSSILTHGLTLVDLPGLGSDTKMHTEITTKYVNKAHCCVLLFGLNGCAADNRAALELMQDYEIMRFPGKSNRFILAINKCDIPYEADLYYGDAIAQAAQSIYDSLHSIEIREIIPISAWYAEYRYILNGVPAENTRAGRLLRRSGKSTEEILCEMKAKYLTPFEYTDPITGEDVEYSTQRFLEETIGEYGVRVRYLNLVKTLADFAYAHQDALKGLRIENQMIAMLAVLGSDLMQELMKSMDAAMKQTQEHFLNNLDEIGKEMDASRVKLADMLKDTVIPAYEEGLGKADSDLNAYMDTEIQKMTSSIIGRYYIDDHDDKSKANQKIHDDLVTHFANYDFVPYLTPGNNLLKDYLERQRDSYDAGVLKLAGCFDALPGQTAQALDLAFEEFKSGSRLQKVLEQYRSGEKIANEIIEVYNRCFQNAKTAITDHLLLLAGHMGSKVMTDNRVKNEIDTSITMVFEFFSSLISRYHRECVGYLDRVQKTAFLSDRPHLNVKQIKRELSLPFCPNNDRKEYVADLNKEMIGQQPESHNIRMEKAFSDAMNDFTNEASRKMNDIIFTVGGKVRNLFSSSKEDILHRFFHIKDSIQLMDESLTNVENDACIRSILDGAYEWSKEGAAAAAMEISMTHEQMGCLLDEVNQNILLVERDVAGTDEGAGETEQV